MSRVRYFSTDEENTYCLRMSFMTPYQCSCGFIKRCSPITSEDEFFHGFNILLYMSTQKETSIDAILHLSRKLLQYEIQHPHSQYKPSIGRILLHIIQNKSISKLSHEFMIDCGINFYTDPCLKNSLSV